MVWPGRSWYSTSGAYAPKSYIAGVLVFGNLATSYAHAMHEAWMRRACRACKVAPASSGTCARKHVNDMSVQTVRHLRSRKERRAGAVLT